MDTITIFLDTNALLHFRHFSEIDWNQLTGAKYVKIVFCMQVINELDDKKRDPRLNERAERVIKAIQTIHSTSGIVREKVTLDVYTDDVKASEFPDTY